MKQIFTKTNDMLNDETKRNQADLDLFGEISKWLGELEEGAVSDVHIELLQMKNCLQVWSEKIYT